MRSHFVLLCAAAALFVLADASSPPVYAEPSVAARGGSEEDAIIPRTPQRRRFSPSPTPSASPSESAQAAPSMAPKRDPVKRGRAGMRGVATGLRLIKAGRSGRIGMQLRNGASFCPHDMSVICVTEGDVHHVHFSLNGRIARTEINAPYVLAGDKNGDIFPWSPPFLGPVKLGCQTQNHHSINVNVVLSCKSSKKSTPNKPLPKNPVVKPVPVKPMPVKPVSVKPVPVKPAPKKPAPKKPAPKKPVHKKPEPNKTVSKKPQPKKPVYKKPVPKKLSLVPNSGPHRSPGFNKQWCVWVHAKSFRVASKGATGRDAWVLVHNGVAYKTSYRGRRTFGPKHQLEYKFTVPVTGHYAIVLDMTTRHYTEHNDMWVSLPDVGIRLRRNLQVRTKSGFLKAYHNKNGRALMSFSVDHNAHTMSSARPLEAGKTYKIIVAGRSSKAVLHRILLFPCEGRNCHDASRVWKKHIDQC